MEYVLMYLACGLVLITCEAVAMICSRKFLRKYDPEKLDNILNKVPENIENPSPLIWFFEFILWPISLVVWLFRIFATIVKVINK